ncbi:MAG TPA: hypothetical protein VJH03_23120 [Blastocatellia bacterium]|nr:hypothetical protein [Blastocatellia bacterium]
MATWLRKVFVPKGTRGPDSKPTAEEGRGEVPADEHWFPGR